MTDITFPCPRCGRHMSIDDSAVGITRPADGRHFQRHEYPGVVKLKKITQSVARADAGGLQPRHEPSG